MKSQVKRALRQVGVLAMLGAVLGTALAGCNTVEGMGEDLEAGGEAIEDAADD
jgi:entericidin B